MSVTAHITVNEKAMKEAERLARQLPLQVPVALSRALNRGIESARTAAVREIRKDYNVTREAVFDTMRIENAIPSRLAAKLTSIGAAIRLAKFDVRPNVPTRKRLTIMVKRGAGRQAVMGHTGNTFWGRMRQGRTSAYYKGIRHTFDGAKTAHIAGKLAVYERTGKGRLPIEQLFGPAIPSMMKNDEVMQVIQRRSQEITDKRILHELDRLDKRISKK